MARLRVSFAAPLCSSFVVSTALLGGCSLIVGATDLSSGAPLANDGGVDAPRDAGDAPASEGGRDASAGPFMRWETISHEDYVTYAFRLILGREPDPSAIENYVRDLNQGTARLQVERGIYQSVEGQNRRADNLWEPALSTAALSNEAFVETMYVILFRRNPDPNARATYPPRLESGTPRADILREAMESDEFSVVR